MSIKIFYDCIKFRLRDWKKARSLIEEVIRKNKRVSGDLNFIITNNENQRKLNVQFLEHDFDTDVITFDYSRGKIIKGEIYINISKVKENALNYNVSLKQEVLRVMIHGVLHLSGQDDNDEIERLKMKGLEDMWLERYEERRNGF